MKTSNTNTQAKTTGRVAAVTGVVIAVVTLAVVTAGIVVSMMPIIQTAHASCITNPKNGATACSGSGGSSSTSSGPVAAPPRGGSFSASFDSKGVHDSCSSGKGSTSTNIPGTVTSSGNTCR